MRARVEFEGNRELTDAKKLQKQLKTAAQVAHILKHNIVQAELRPKDSVLQVKLDPSRHEFGDNDSRKKAGTAANVEANRGCCCS